MPRPILPAPKREDNGPARQPPAQLTSRRKAVSVACGPCRKRKIKCDGRRPICAPCDRKSEECRYSNHDGRAPRPTLSQRLGDLEREVADLRELIGHIQTKPQQEASDIVDRLRRAEEPLDVLQAIRETRAEAKKISIAQIVNPTVEAPDAGAVSDDPANVPSRS